MIINVYWFSCKVPIIPVRLNEAWIFLIILKKYSNIKFHENLSSGNRVVLRGQTDTQKDMPERQTWWSEESFYAILLMCLNHGLNSQATEQQTLMCDLRYFGMLSEVD